MSVAVYTARISSRDPDRLDVTRKSATTGLFLAPSWSILSPVLHARNEYLEAQREAEKRGFGLDETRVDGPAVQWEIVWANYQRSYLAEMRRSYVQFRDQWLALLARPRVVLCCYCVDAAHCHRTLLARDILPKLGATNAGETER